MLNRVLRQLIRIILIAVFWQSSSYSADNMEVEGKWNKPGIPHKGWAHIDVEDLEEATGECQMCDKKHIRYLHTVSHPDWEDLVVGRDCAEKMCEDYENPKVRENKAKSQARKRVREAEERLRVAQEAAAREAARVARIERNWLDLTSWRTTQKGGYSHRLGDDWINMFKRGIHWKYVFKNQFSDNAYQNIQDALQASLNQYRQYIVA